MANKPYPKHPLDPNDPDYDPKLDPHNSQYDPNDPRLVGGMWKRVGLQAPPSKAQTEDDTMSSEEADQYLAARRAKSGNAVSPTMSTEEANQYLKKYRAQQQPLAPTGEASLTGTPQQQAPLATGTQPVTAPSTSSDIYRSLPDVVQKHPYLSALGVAAGVPLAAAVLPEGAMGAMGSFLVREGLAPMLRIGGLGYMADVASGGKLSSKIMELLTSGLSEGGGGSAP